MCDPNQIPADLPELVRYSEESEYREHFERIYCQGPIETSDSLLVRFRKDDFEHCFFESSDRRGNKDTFSLIRAERIDWISYALQSGSCAWKAGWDHNRRRYDHDRRVTILIGEYVVVISLISPERAQFVTAFVADSASTREKLQSAPEWVNPFI